MGLVLLLLLWWLRGDGGCGDSCCVDNGLIPMLFELKGDGCNGQKQKTLDKNEEISMMTLDKNETTSMTLDKNEAISMTLDKNETISMTLDKNETISLTYKW